MKASSMLSQHFSLAELTVSQTAARLGIVNLPGTVELANLRHLAKMLEAVRRCLNDVPLIISSGFRAPLVNRFVGGSTNSAHCRGLAADFIAPDFGSPREVVQQIVDSGLLFDQLIDEFGWCHFAIVPEGRTGRQQVLTMQKEKR